MPQLHKHRSPWHFDQARQHARRCCDSIPASHNRLHTDGSIANGVGVPFTCAIMCVHVHYTALYRMHTSS
jgi:hypothetical protein